MHIALYKKSLHLVLENLFKHLFKESLNLQNISNINVKKSIKQKKLEKSLKYVNLSTANNRLYKSSNWIKSSVSSMTSAEEDNPLPMNRRNDRTLTPSHP